MLKKSARLTTRQFNQVLQKGRVYHSSLFLMRAMSKESDMRISAVAPVKIARKATIRNRIRRKTYAEIKLCWRSIPAGLHAIVFAKKDISDSESVDMQKDLKELFNKAKSV